MKSFVLVVDDDVDTRSLAQHILKSDFEVVTVNGGATAINLLKSFRPDVIVADLMMPALDGVSLIQAIKNMKDCKDIPVIVLTGFAEGYRELVTNAGASMVLEKPEGTLELADKVKKVLAAQG
jgi:CheY-like chemotaxis protein